MTAKTLPSKDEHALLGASSAHLWLACTAMPRATEHIKDEGSIYAAEGTLAHDIAELKLTKHFGERSPTGAKAPPMTSRTYNSRMNKLKKTVLYDEDGKPRDPADYWAEMQACTDVYLDKIKEITLGYPSTPSVVIEQHLDFSEWVPEGFGRGDFASACGDVLDIVDYKHGKGKFVHVEDNPQFMLYALGAYAFFRVTHAIKTVRMTVVQPRLDNVATAKMTIDDLLAWGESTRPCAQAAFYGFGTFTPGTHCHDGFCKLDGKCRAQAESCFAVIKEAAEPAAGLHLPTPPVNPVMSNEEVAFYLDKVLSLGVDTWVKKLRAHGLDELLKGNTVPGFKAVAGRAGKREYTDIEAVVKALDNSGYEGKTVLYDYVPKSVAELEKTLGKATFTTLCAGLTTQPPGKATIERESDPRPPITPHTPESDFADAPLPELPSNP